MKTISYIHFINPYKMVTFIGFPNIKNNKLYFVVIIFINHNIHLLYIYACILIKVGIVNYNIIVGAYSI